MQVDGTRADGTAARQGNLGLAAACQQRPHDEEGRAHLAHEVIGGLAAADHAAVHMQLMFRGIEVRLDPQEVQHLRDGMHILQCRHLIQQARSILPQKRCGDNGQHRILCPADLDAALQAVTTINYQFFHSASHILPARKKHQLIVYHHRA